MPETLNAQQIRDKINALLKDKRREVFVGLTFAPKNEEPYTVKRTFDPTEPGKQIINYWSGEWAKESCVSVEVAK